MNLLVPMISYGSLKLFLHIKSYYLQIRIIYFLFFLFFQCSLLLDFFLFLICSYKTSSAMFTVFNQTFFHISDLSPLSVFFFSHVFAGVSTCACRTRAESQVSCSFAIWSSHLALTKPFIFLVRLVLPNTFTSSSPPFGFQESMAVPDTFIKDLANIPLNYPPIPQWKIY